MELETKLRYTEIKFKVLEILNYNYTDEMYGRKNIVEDLFELVRYIEEDLESDITYVMKAPLD